MNQDGNFEFTIPVGAELDQVSTFGPSGMPVRQGTIDKGKGRYAIAYAFQPGQNGVRISYILPYVLLSTLFPILFPNLFFILFPALITMLIYSLQVNFWDSVQNA